MRVEFSDGDQTPKDLDPQTKLIIAGKIARLCEVEPEEFDAMMQPYEAQEIIRAIDPLVGFSEPSNVISLKPPKRKGLGRITGFATLGGNVSIDFQGGGTGQRITKGRDEYRIGSYVVIKFEPKNSNLLVMNFEDYYGHEAVNQVLQNFPPKTSIYYWGENLVPAFIYRFNIAKIITSKKWLRKEQNISPVYDQTLMWQHPGLMNSGGAEGNRTLA